MARKADQTREPRAEARAPRLPLRPPPLPVAALSDRERVACLRLSRTEGVGPITFRELVNWAGGATQALERLPDLARRGGRKRAPRIPSVTEAEDELAAAGRAGAQALFTIEPGYPPLLAALSHPPPMIYVRGRTDLFARAAVGIVGSRQASAAGITMARRLAGDLGREDIAIVSGLARGIDRAAHEASLESGTIAVVAGGIDVVYPPEHAALQEAIAADGAIVSEQPPGLSPRGRDFPRRNRIISGLSHGVIIVEAAMRSGSLITARMAGEHGRDVFAVPGHPLDPRAYGTNTLLKDGAILTTEARDVIVHLSSVAGRAPTVGHDGDVRPISNMQDAGDVLDDPPLSAGHAAASDDVRGLVTNALGPAPIAVDDLIRATRLPARAVQTALLELALAGQVTHHGQQLVALTPVDENTGNG